MGKKSKRRGGGGGGGGKNGPGSLGIAGLKHGAVRSATAGSVPSDPSPRSVVNIDHVGKPLTNDDEIWDRYNDVRSLRGITCTNVDPGKCAVCQGEIRLHVRLSGPGFMWTSCCGKHVCLSCFDVDAHVYNDILGYFRCTFCNVVVGGVSKMENMLRNNANLGKPWAQYQLGERYLVDGRDKSLDMEKIEAGIKWFETAAAQGHPGACLNLATYYLFEEVPRNLVKAEIYAERARAIHSKFVPVTNDLLFCIAGFHKACDEAAAERILSRLIADDRASSVMFNTGNSLHGMKCYDLAALAYERCAMDGSISAPLDVACCYINIQRYSLGRIWLLYTFKTRAAFAIDPSEWSKGQACRDECRGILRKIRDACGGCGATLQGETRKYCAGCRTYCYCNRDCQKRHWSRSQDGHREECKEAGKCVIKLQALLDKAGERKSA